MQEEVASTRRWFRSYTNGRTDAAVFKTKIYIFLEPSYNPLRQVFGPPTVRELVHENDIFVSPNSSDQISLTGFLKQDHSNCRQNLVAGSVTQTIIDQFEVVEIDSQRRHSTW
ncbi:MAG: hypothetical protein Gyms2KO_22960 [Gymnodinialimonas sp.]